MENNIYIIIGKKTEKLQRLIRTINESEGSSFYKKIWANEDFKKENVDFKSFPIIGIKEIMECKFDERLYIKNGLFVKIIYHNKVPFLIARTKNDISKENYGQIPFRRPLVIFESPHESIEKGLWLHDKNVLPLIAEDNLDLTLMIAGRYNIDSILGDTESIKKIISSRSSYFEHKKITNVTIIDSKFERDLATSLKGVFPNTKTQIILALPETGSLGFQCKKEHDRDFIFHSAENSFVEMDESGHLIATRLILLPTPIIRYKTNIKIREENKNCSCESELIFSIENQHENYRR